MYALGYSDRNELLSSGCLWLDGTVYWHLTGRLLVNCEEYGLYVVCLSLTRNGTEKCGEHENSVALYSMCVEAMANIMPIYGN